MMNINTKKYIEEFVKIRDKSGNIINFKFNKPQQKLYDIIKKQKKEGKPVRVVILKARQMGFSTEVESIIFKETTTKFNVNSGIITHKTDATTNLFNMSKRIYDNLPLELKPTQLASNAKELVFDNEEGTGLKSKIKCMTAGSGVVGRSDTFNNLHISEFAFWGGNKKEQLTGLMQAVPNLPNTMVIIESTANGYEFFKEFWDDAVEGKNDFIPLFVGWNELDEYQMPYTGFELTIEEKKLMEIFNLSLEQITWRRWCIRNNCQNDIKLFEQEYPIIPEEAFIATGNTVFDSRAIQGRLKSVSKPIKIGYFTYKYDGLKISEIKWVNDKNGYIKIYKVPNAPNITKYCIGGDTAGDGSDFFTGHVLDAKTGEQVAVLKHELDADLYTKQMYCLGKYYKDALIGIESNYDSYPIRELQRLGYINQYIREQFDSYTGKLEKKYGFRTTTLTRPTIISRLVEIVRENIEKINDVDTLRELIAIIRNEDGKIEAPSGCHDDQMMGLAIAHEIRLQVVFDEEPIYSYPEFKDLFEDDTSNLDYGGEIKIV